MPKYTKRKRQRGKTRKRVKRRVHRLRGAGDGWQPATKQELHQAINDYIRGDRSKGEIGTWDVTRITSFSMLFQGLQTFNEPGISDWETSQVTDMRNMFGGCTSFNQPLDWDTSEVEDMSSMFVECTAFNQPLNWNTSKVKDMSSMFGGCSAFNQPLEWKTSQVTRMGNMFRGCTSFNQPLDWDTSEVIVMTRMFTDCRSFNQPLNWNTSKVISTSSMFSGCTSFNKPLKWDTSQVTHMDDMFRNCTSFNQRLAWDTSHGEDMARMFYGCTSLNQSVEIDIREVHAAVEIFAECTSLRSNIYLTIPPGSRAYFSGVLVDLPYTLGLTNGQDQLLHIRERRGSVYVPFQELLQRKQAENQEKAIATMTYLQQRTENGGYLLDLRKVDPEDEFVDYFQRRPELARYKLSTRRGSVYDRSNCFRVTFRSDREMHIEALKYPTAPNCSYTGREVLSNLIEAARHLGLNKITLEDESSINIAGQYLSLSAYSLLKYGKSWYEGFGFEQEGKVPDFDERLRYIRTTPLVEVIGNFAPHLNSLLSLPSIYFDVKNPQNDERTVVDILNMLSTRKDHEAGVIKKIVDALHRFLAYNHNLVFVLPRERPPVEEEDAGSTKRARVDRGGRRTRRKH